MAKAIEKMKNKLIEIYNGIIWSFDNQPKGFSSRKLSAFAVMVMVVVLHIKWFKSAQWQYIEMILGLDYGFVLTCFGINTWQRIKEKEKKPDDANAQP